MEAISEITTQPTEPHDQVKKKPYRQQNATSDLLEAVLFGSAVPTIATMNMQMVCAAPPQRRIARLPRYLTDGNMIKMPASWVAWRTILAVKACFTPETLKKYVPYLSVKVD